MGRMEYSYKSTERMDGRGILHLCPKRGDAYLSVLCCCFVGWLKHLSQIHRMSGGNTDLGDKTGENKYKDVSCIRDSGTSDENDAVHSSSSLSSCSCKNWMVEGHKYIRKCKTWRKPTLTSASVPLRKCWRPCGFEPFWCQ